MKPGTPKTGETVDTLYGGAIRLIQRRSGYRFTSDAVILAHAALGARGRLVDLGTGCGVIPVIVAKFGRADAVTGVEIQPELVDIAARNVVDNGVADRTAIVHGDIRRIRDLLPAQSFDQVIANPPYLAVTAGRINPDHERAVARHEILCRIQDILAAALHLLRNHGVLRIIYPNTRLVDLALQLRRKGLEPKRLRFVHDHADGPSKVCLVEATKNARAQVEIAAPIILYDAAGRPTDEHRRIFGSPEPVFDPQD